MADIILSHPQSVRSQQMNRELTGLDRTQGTTASPPLLRYPWNRTSPAAFYPTSLDLQHDRVVLHDHPNDPLSGLDIVVVSNHLCAQVEGRFERFIRVCSRGLHRPRETSPRTIISISAFVVSLNTGVSMRITPLPSRVSSSASWTVSVQDSSSLPTCRAEPLARLIKGVVG